jgi:hypothetical protein
MQLYEKYRPKTIDDVLGQTKAVKVIKRLIQNGAGGAVFGSVAQAVLVKLLWQGLSPTILPMSGLSRTSTVLMAYRYRP